MPRKYVKKTDRAAPKALEAAQTVEKAIPLAKADKAGFKVNRRYHEPYGRDCWDVHYIKNGEPLTDLGFLTEEAALSHVVSLGLG